MLWPQPRLELGNSGDPMSNADMHDGSCDGIADEDALLVEEQAS